MSTSGLQCSTAMRQAHVGPHLVRCPSSRLGLSPSFALRPLRKLASAPSDSTRWRPNLSQRAKRGVSGLRARVCRSQIGEALVDSSADLDVCQQVAEVLPSIVDLDCRLDHEHSLVGKLDTARLQAASNSLSSLWSDSGKVADSKLAALPLSSRQLLSCLLAGLHCNSSVPYYLTLVTLQQNVWQKMHSTLGSGAATCAAYAPSLEALDTTAETVQTVLLMAQNGVAGLNSESCFALALHLDDSLGVTSWLQNAFGADFVNQVQAVANHGGENNSIAVKFPSHELPKLSIIQLNDGTSVFALQAGYTPDWMRPATVWDPQFMQELGVRASTGKLGNVPPAIELSAAETLQLQYGEQDKGSKQKRHKQ